MLEQNRQLPNREPSRDRHAENAFIEEAQYSDNSFWNKLKDFALKAGKEVVEKALTLYYCMQDPETPKWAKRSIIGALAYFISPLDAIPDIVPFLGFTDDLGVLAMAIAAVATHIKEKHKAQAKEMLKTWFR